MSTARSVAAAEVAKFARLHRAWWDPHGPLRTLHQLNPTRVRYIADTVARFTVRSSAAALGRGGGGAACDPLQGISALDVGCGGGVLAEALARRGAAVTAIDVCAESIEVARQRQLELEQLRSPPHAPISFELASVFDLSPEKRRFELVVASEVLEHVDEPAAVLAHLCGLVADNGCLVITTLNKTLFSGLLYVALAEGAGVVPPGTHEWQRFLPPADVTRVALQHRVQCVDVSGVAPIPDLAASLWAGAPTARFGLTRRCTAGHYFWSGVRLAGQ